MTKLEKIAELRSRAEEALRRSFSELYHEDNPDTSNLEMSLPLSHIETLIENEELRLTKARLQAELNRYKGLYKDKPDLQKNKPKEKEKAYHELISNISEGIFYTKQGILKSVNPSLADILGYSEKELEGKPLWELIAHCYQEPIRNLFLKKESVELKPAYDIKCERKDGTVFWAELKVKHLNNGSKSFGTISDITQRKLNENKLKASERSLKRSNAAKDKFFSIIAHDLKTPFSTLMGYTYLLMKEYKQYDDNKRETMIRSLYDITKQTFNLLENILVWSRSQTESMPFAPRSISISKLLFENIRLYNPTAKAKNITLSTGSDVKDIFVFADPEMIQTVIRNLVANAIKFTPEKGNITLDITDNGDEKITVSITDTGVGINRDKKGLLFRIDNNNSTLGTHDEKGTGLGLVICKEFVEKNGGELKVDSTPGKGSKFSFTLFKKIRRFS